MYLLGVVLIVIGIAMAWSGYSMDANKKRYDKLLNRGVLSPSPREYGFHSRFKAYWWIPLVIGLLLIIFS